MNGQRQNGSPLVALVAAHLDASDVAVMAFHSSGCDGSLVSAKLSTMLDSVWSSMGTSGENAQKRGRSSDHCIVQIKGPVASDQADWIVEVIQRINQASANELVTMMGEEAVEVQKYVRHQGEIADADILA